jgi:hypothetical protein
MPCWLHRGPRPTPAISREGAAFPFERADMPIGASVDAAAFRDGPTETELVVAVRSSVTQRIGAREPICAQLGVCVASVSEVDHDPPMSDREFDAQERLQRAVASDPNPILVVGAGVSLASASSARSWKRLVEHRIDYANEAGALDDSLADALRARLASKVPSELIEVASEVEQRLRARSGEFERWLTESVGDLKVSDSALIRALRRLGVKIATTNYDLLLTQNGGPPPYTWQQPQQCLRVLFGDEEGIVHLHGVYSDAESVVFGRGGITVSWPTSESSSSSGWPASEARSSSLAAAPASRIPTSARCWNGSTLGRRHTSTTGYAQNVKLASCTRRQFSMSHMAQATTSSSTSSGASLGVGALGDPIRNRSGRSPATAAACWPWRWRRT